MKSIIVTLLLLMFTFQVNAYQYYVISSNVMEIYDTETLDHSWYKIEEDIGSIIYQTNEILVYSTYNDTAYDFEGNNYRTSELAFYTKEDHKLITRISDCFNVTYNPAFNLMIGTRGGHLVSDKEIFENEIHGFYVLDLNNNELDTVDFPGFVVETPFMPGISIKSDDSLLAVLSETNKVSYYDLKDLSKLVKVEESSLYNYSHDAKYRCGKTTGLEFFGPEGFTWKPELDFERGLDFYISQGYWFNNKNVFYFFGRFFDVEKQKIYKIERGYPRYFYDISDDIFIREIKLEENNEIRYKQYDATEMLEKWRQ